MTAPSRDLDAMKRKLLDAMSIANEIHGAEHEVPGMRAAIVAWPDAALALRLPAEIRDFLERELGGLQ